MQVPYHAAGMSPGANSANLAIVSWVQAARGREGGNTEGRGVDKSRLAGGWKGSWKRGLSGKEMRK